MLGLGNSLRPMRIPLDNLLDWARHAIEEEFDQHGVVNSVLNSQRLIEGSRSLDRGARYLSGVLRSSKGSISFCVD
jgi:hypothetical protein